MNLAPEKATFVVGKTSHNQVVEVQYDKGLFNIVIQAVSQRDETQTIRGLTLDHLLTIASVADLVKSWPAK